MSEQMKEYPSPSENLTAVESVFDARASSEKHSAEETEKTVGSKVSITAQQSGSAFQKESSQITSRTVSKPDLTNEDTEGGLSREKQTEDSSVHEQPTAESSDLERLKSISSVLESREKTGRRLYKHVEKKITREASGVSEDTHDLDLARRSQADFDEEVERYDTTLLGSRTSGLGISRQVSPDQLHAKLLALEREKRAQPHVSAEKLRKFSDRRWSDDVWLQIAARQRALRRSRKPADIELRKRKYPELFRSDVSINPSYTDYKLPYFVVARQRYLRSLRHIQEQIRGDIEEMALLQPRALDGVRIIRAFCQGVPHDTVKDPLNPKERRRLEYLLVGTIY